MMKLFYHDARDNGCAVPAPSVRFSEGEWGAIVRHLGKGRDRRGSAAEPEEHIERRRLTEAAVLLSPLVLPEQRTTPPPRRRGERHRILEAACLA